MLHHSIKLVGKSITGMGSSLAAAASSHVSPVRVWKREALAPAMPHDSSADVLHAVETC